VPGGIEPPPGAQKRAPVLIKDASENFEDEDLIEMVNAGLIPLTIINAPVPAR
jgi:membrane-bound lytic murein transglycosylase MltF